MTNSHYSDPNVEVLQRVSVMEMILQVLCRTTGMRIALVARVTETDWTACAVLDEAGFGLRVGDHLDVEDTY